MHRPNKEEGEAVGEEHIKVVEVDPSKVVPTWEHGNPALPHLRCSRRPMVDSLNRVVITPSNTTILNSTTTNITSSISMHILKLDHLLTEVLLRTADLITL